MHRILSSTSSSPQIGQTPVGKVPVCSVKCHAVAVALILLIGCAALVYGLTFSSTAAIGGGGLASICAIVYGLFWGCSNASKPEKEGDRFSFDQFAYSPQYRTECLKSVDFWNHASEALIQEIAPFIHDTEIFWIPFREIESKTVVLLYRALNKNSDAHASRRQIAERSLSLELIREMNEEDIGISYTSAIVLHFCSEDPEYSLENRFGVQWSDLKNYHEKLLCGLLRYGDRAITCTSLMQHFLERPAELIINGKPLTLKELYIFLQKRNFNFIQFFSNARSFGKCPAFYVLHLSEVSKIEDPILKLQALKPLIKNKFIFPDLMVLLLNNLELREGFKDLIDEMLFEAVSTQRLLRLKMKRIYIEGQLLLLKALRQNSDTASMYMRRNFSPSLIPHLTDEEIALYYGKAFIHYFTKDRDEVKGYMWEDLSDHQDRILNAIRSHFEKVPDVEIDVAEFNDHVERRLSSS